MRDAVDGDRVVSVSTRGQALWVRWAKAGEAFRDEGHRWLPDLDDPATLGCIENALLPEAWGGDVFVSIDTHLTRDGRVRTVVIVDADGEPEPGEWAATSKAEALVLSLESAGRREVSP